MCEPDMHRTHDPGTTNHMEGAPAANKCFVPEPTVKYNTGIHYNRLIHRRCASLDLETAFKEIKISQNIKKKVCKQGQAEFSNAQHLRQGRCAHQYHQCLPVLVTNKFPSWWQTNQCNNCSYLCRPLLTKKRIEKLQRFVDQVNITGLGHIYVVGITISCMMH